MNKIAVHHMISLLFITGDTEDASGDVEDTGDIEDTEDE